MRIALITVAALALALFVLWEIGMAYPVVWWLYLSVGIAFAAALIRPVPVRSQLARMSVLVAILGFIVVLYCVEWTTRKRFLRDLARVHVGMTEVQVRQIMGRYMAGTGWPGSPFDTSSNRSTLFSVGSSSQYATTTSPSGEMVISNSLVFRHSTDGAFNSDFGIVSLSSGRVVRVEFSPD